MSNDIKIYIHDDDAIENMHIEITPALARQIVALARDVNEEQKCPPEARIAPAKLILNPSGTMHTAQPLDMTRRIGPGIVDARHAPAKCQHPRAYHAMACNHCPDCGHLWGGPLEGATTPVDAGGDDAVGPFTKEHMGRMASDIAAKDAALSARHLQVKEMHAEIADLRARLADAERERSKSISKNCQDAAIALAAERERREKAEAHLAVSLATVAPYNDVCMERDSARAEVAALKAWKVKLPSKCPYEMSEVVRQCAYYRGVSDCADAIRAAGVEVE